MAQIEPKSVEFMGIRIDNVNAEDIRESIHRDSNSRGYLCLLDVKTVYAATRDEDLRDSINRSTIVVADGTPITWFARFMGCRRIERVSGLDLLNDLLQEKNNLRHFLLGDSDLIQMKIMRKAKGCNSGIDISGYSPPLKDSFDESDIEQMIRVINDANPDIVWVCFGDRKQNKWMFHNIHRINRGYLIGVGAAFRYYIGELYTPSRLIQRMGLQWVFRIIHEPVKRSVYRKAVPFFLGHFPLEVLRGKTGLFRRSSLS